MSLEQRCRRKPDIKGIPVKLRGGEVWLIPETTVVPVFEKEDGQWIFKRLGVAAPYKSRYDRITELWEKAGEKDSLPPDLYQELAKLGLELPAMALDQNYDLTADQLGMIIDPSDQKMLTGIMAALRGVDRSKEPEDTEEPPEDEKKKRQSG